MRRNTVPLLCAVIMLSLCAHHAYGNGYKIVCVKSAKATGMAEAFTALADDPTAITFNPAGIAQLRGHQLNTHLTLCYAYTEHESPTGVKTESERILTPIPSIFVTSDIGRDDMAIGIGLSLPNAFATEWDADSFSRYVATRSDFKVADLSPAIGIRLSNRCMLGAAVNLLWADAKLDRMVDAGLAAGAPGTMDLAMSLEGTGMAVGGLFGTIWEISQSQRLAVTYRLPVTITTDGEFDLGGVIEDVEATIDIPATAVVGYMFRPAPKWAVEFDLDWTDWKMVDDITIEPKTAGRASSVIRQKFRNTLIYKLGAEYSVSDSLRLRLGYMYDEDAAREETWRPSLPDTDLHFINVGLGYDWGSLTFDAAVQGTIYEKKRVDNNVDSNEDSTSSSIDGTYSTTAPSISIGLTHRF